MLDGYMYFALLMYLVLPLTATVCPLTLIAFTILPQRDQK